MNIKQAKDYIKNSVQLYLEKDEFGEYRIPVVRQRPVFLLGAPGIGKTAIMEQIAQEMDIALVSYSMTHHTRQSALGLPFITRKTYGGIEADVTEYTMSEIIASVYETMENGGKTEGILFLDEINCVSETLAPSMLQFLQYKVFGRHSVPEGWVIVTAGNPPEYNKSVREFDVVTMDRLKVLEVEPDLGCWKSYAAEKGIHGAITAYLDLKKEHFYCMETTVYGKSYVTARGWEDLSEILNLYEEKGLVADETLVGQYLRNEKVVKEFTAYYDLYNKYKRDYRIEEILKGTGSEQAVERAKAAQFDERLSLLGMLLDRVQADMKDIMERADYLGDLRNILKSMEEGALTNTAEWLISSLQQKCEAIKKILDNLQSSNALSDDRKKRHRRVIRFLEECKKELTLASINSGTEGYDFIKRKYGETVLALRQDTEVVKNELHFLFDFVEKAFGSGNEMLILVTELTVSSAGARFIATFSCPDYQRHNSELMLSERNNDIKLRIANLDL